MSYGEPIYGVTVNFRGEIVPPGQLVHVANADSSGRLVLALQKLQGGKDVIANPGPNLPEDQLTIDVNPSPLSRNQ